MPELKISESHQQEVGSWSRFKNSKKWLELVEYLDKRIEEAEKIVNSIGTDSDKEYSKRDIALLKKNEALNLKEFPQKMIDFHSSTGERPVENFDAFGDQYESDRILDEAGDDDI